MSEQPTLSLIVKKESIMPDGSVGSVAIGYTKDPREIDLLLTFAQARTLAIQLIEKIGK